MRWIVFCLGLFLLSAAGCGGGGVAKVSPFAGTWSGSFWYPDGVLRIARLEVDKRGKVSGACWLVTELGLERGEASGAFKPTGEGVLTLRYPAGWQENFPGTATPRGAILLDLQPEPGYHFHFFCYPPFDTATESGSYEGTFELMGRSLPVSLSLGAQGEMAGSYVDNGRQIAFAGWLSNNSFMVGYTSNGVFYGGFDLGDDGGGTRLILHIAWMQERDDSGKLWHHFSQTMRLTRK